MAEFTVSSSKKITKRNLKILFWGDTGTRKTEEILRNFPGVLLIDAEGNSDQCVDNPDIPEFLQVKTKDPRVAIKVIDQAALGKIKFDDGRPIETLAIDGWTVLWNVQKEFAQTNAEKRAAKYNKPAEETNATQLDWGLAKRPLSMLMNRMNNSAIKYLVLTAREAPLYAPGNENQKIGERPDVVKGTLYEMNLALRFINTAGVWSYETTKVQGTLGNIFPIGKGGKKVDYTKLFGYASNFKPAAVKEKSEEDIAGEQAEDAARTKDDLIAYGKQRGLDLQAIGVALKAAEFTGVDLARWGEMIEAIDAYAAQLTQ